MNKKKLFILISTLLFSLALTSCWDEDKVITQEQLPQAAQVYLQKNYPTESVMLVKQENELFSKIYKVHLSSGIELEFNSDGEVIDIDIDD